MEKSTVVNLIARFWDTDSGTVSIGGTDIKAMTTESLLENISVVFQNVYLFNDTVFNNVAFGKRAQQKKMLSQPAKRPAATSLYLRSKMAMTQ
ncbi:MAG: ATP-binding cassette domain-containing protein [Lachnospiraceae bacterium]